MKNLLKSLRWQNFLFLLIAGIINAIGVTIFLAPVKLYDSGISGTSILLSQITPAGLKTIDFVVEGIDRSKSVMIVTDKPEEINKALLETFECGTTKIAATGGYSNKDKTIIYFVVNRFQISRMRTVIHNIDPKAFVTISEVADVFKSND